MSARQAYEQAGRALRHLDVSPAEITRFDRLTKSDIGDTPESDIHSTGYVVHTLEAAIWWIDTLARKTDIEKLAQKLEPSTPHPLPNPPR